MCAMASLLDRIRVVLCATSHPGNIGASARAMQTMGLSRLVLVTPQRFPDADADAMAAGAGASASSSEVATPAACRIALAPAASASASASG